MGEVSDKFNKYCSIQALVGFDVNSKRIVRECLISFPYTWASVDSLNLWYMPEILNTA